VDLFHDFESLGWVDYSRAQPVVCESFRGADVVSWHGNIERQINGFLADAEKSRNWPYADKLREFLKIWRENSISGSINRETLDTLKTPAEVLAVDNWTFNNYFSNLRDRIRMLIASEEELPRDMDMGGEEPLRGTSRGRGAPPLNPQFGPEEEPPGGAGGMPPEGAPGVEGAGGEVPPGAEGVPEPGEEVGGPPGAAPPEGEEEEEEEEEEPLPPRR
jgi:hypothetical protein